MQCWYSGPRNKERKRPFHLKNMRIFFSNLESVFICVGASAPTSIEGKQTNPSGGFCARKGILSKRLPVRAEARTHVM